MNNSLGISEAKAKKKWCRHGIMAASTGLVDSDRTPCNRSKADEPVCFCIGEACMDWVTVEERDEPEGNIGYCGANDRREV